MFDSNASYQDHHITVLPNRSRFQESVSRILEHHAAGSRGSAVLHVTVQSFSGTGAVSMRLLNLTGVALRAAMRDGEVAYLGDAEFAVFLHDTDAREAAHYARTVVGMVGSFRVEWQDQMLSVSAHVGGVMADDGVDGTALLEKAIAASEAASHKFGCKVHLTHSVTGAAAEPPEAATENRLLERIAAYA
ncbi:MAG TPA: diguanylate cyclase [Gammaproteobacteria bacterium]|jgi:GGDEF domain-containing protein